MENEPTYYDPTYYARLISELLHDESFPIQLDPQPAGDTSHAVGGLCPDGLAGHTAATGSENQHEQNGRAYGSTGQKPAGPGLITQPATYSVGHIPPDAESAGDTSHAVAGLYPVGLASPTAATGTEDEVLSEIDRFLLGMPIRTEDVLGSPFRTEDVLASPIRTEDFLALPDLYPTGHTSSRCAEQLADVLSSSPDLEINTGTGLPQATRPNFDLGSVTSSPPPPYFPFPPSLIACSQWEKRECIGRGAVGHVYRGYNSEHRQFCAIKEVLVISNDRHSRELLNQINQEIFFLKQLSHPNIVQYYGTITTDRALSIYMEFVSKGSIHSLLANNGPFKESMIRSYAAQILSGLAFMHERKHIHRDIKGANILVGSNNEVKIADFGLTKHIQTLTAVHTSCRGTPYWMAPEVILSNSTGEGYNLPSDIWSVGCTIIEMATGKPPLHGHEPHQAMFKIAYEKTYIPEIPDTLSDEGKNFLLLCLQRDPKSRPSAAQLMDHPFIRNQGS